MNFPIRSARRAAAIRWAAIFLSVGLATGQIPELKISGYAIDAENRFTVRAKIPEGSRHAILEAMIPLRTGMAWRQMIATSLDGRPADVEFRLPRDGAPAILARVRAGDSTSYPAPELTGAGLCSVAYGLSESEKMTFLGAAAIKWNDWKELPRLDGFAQLVAWLKGQPHVADASVSSMKSAVFIETDDGDTLTLFTKPKPTAADIARDFPGGAGYPVPAVTAVGGGPGFKVSSVAAKGLPESNVAICANFLEPYFPNSAPTIAGWLNGQGYSASVKSMATVSEVKGWFSGGNVGVLFMHAHGFPYPNARDGEQIAISLNQPAQETPEDASYAEMRRLGELKRGCELGKNNPVYGISRLFIRKYMKFSPHSLVMADTCYGAHAELGNAFEAAGAGAYVSWDWESGPQSNTRFLQLADRLLGMNSQAPVSFPGERPFPLPVVKDWMVTKGFDYDPTPGLPRSARFGWHFHASRPAHLLRPSIRGIEPENTATTTQMKLTGDFGKDPGAAGKVLWGGREVHVAGWNQDTGILVDQLSVPLPTGDFEVKVYNRHSSNSTPLTQWDIPFKYEVKGKGSLQYTINANFKVRFDVHGVRDKPQDPVTYPLVPFLNFKDLTGTATASGSYYDSPNPQTGGTTYTWSGNRTLTSYDQGGNGVAENFLLGSALLDTETGVPQFFMVNAVSYLDESANGFPYQVLIGFDPLTSAYLPVTFNRFDGWKVSGKTVPGFPLHVDRIVSATMTWPNVTPAAVPTDETVR